MVRQHAMPMKLKAQQTFFLFHLEDRLLANERCEVVPMRRRDFIQAAGAAVLLGSARSRAAAVHNFDGYDFGAGPPVPRAPPRWS